MAEIIIEIVFKYIILGIWIGLKSAYNWLKEMIFGVPTIETEKRKLKKKWLYKKVVLKVNLENSIRLGTIGTVMEFIDKKTVLVKFYDKKRDFIEIDNKLTFIISLMHLKLEK